MRNRFAVFCFLFACLVISSCAQGIDRVSEDMSVKGITEIADSYLEDKKYQYAGEVYMEVDRLYRYSDSARTALIKASRAFHISGDYEMCRLAANRFLEDFPESKQAPQAKYLIGLCYYEQIPDISRDQRPAKEALREFTELIEEYPGSNYTSQAKEKFNESLTQIAGQELEIGKYYMKKNQVLAAIGRYTVVVENYSMTSYQEEGFFRLFEAFTLMGLKQESMLYFGKLKQSYPNSSWLIEAENIKSF